MELGWIIRIDKSIERSMRAVVIIPATTSGKVGANLNVRLAGLIRPSTMSEKLRQGRRGDEIFCYKVLRTSWKLSIV